MIQIDSAAGTFLSRSAKRASKNYAICYGTIKVADQRARVSCSESGQLAIIDNNAPKRFRGRMPLLTFAWLDCQLTPRHRPIAHSLN